MDTSSPPVTATDAPITPTASARSVAPAALLADPDRYDGQRVTTSGVVRQLAPFMLALSASTGADSPSPLPPTGTVATAPAAPSSGPTSTSAAGSGPAGSVKPLGAHELLVVYGLPSGATTPTFQVYLSGRAQPVAARLVGTYRTGDLAVIQLDDAKGVRPATFADPGEATVGDPVLAMGNPLGLSATVTDGIVSAVGRTVTEPAQGGNPGATIPNAIQTSASINPGNRGGAW